MAESAGEKKRKKTLKRAKSARNMVATAAASIPALLRDLDEIVDALEPPKPPAKEEKAK